MGWSNGLTHVIVLMKWEDGVGVGKSWVDSGCNGWEFTVYLRKK